MKTLKIGEDDFNFAGDFYRLKHDLMPSTLLCIKNIVFLLCELKKCNVFDY